MQGLGQEIADHVAVLQPAEQQVQRAEQALGGLDARNAIAAAQAASGIAEQINATLERYTAIRAGIVQGRNDAERLIAEGYRMEASQAALDGARTALSEASKALQTGGTEASAPKLQAAQMMLDEAVANGTGLVTLRAANAQRIAAIQAEGEGIRTLIEQGRQAFDLVDEFAESTWNDIRGNGSEAQAAANRAHEHWEQAQQRNTMETQEFHEAKENLDSANQELAFVRQLIDAITGRLRDLEQARSTAKELLDEAERSLAAGWEFVRANDADVGKDPEGKLRQADQLLKSAKAEAAQAKPNWLTLVRDAQASDSLSDTALVGARSEAEAMEKLRQHTAKANQLASAEVIKSIKFANLHSADMQPATVKNLEALKNRLDQAISLEQQATDLEETKRRKALEQSLEAFQKLQSETEKVYQALYADFQKLEQLRSDLNSELSRARNALKEAQSLRMQANARVPSTITKRLKSAQHSFDQISLPINGAQQITKTINVAKAINSEARDIIKDLRSLIRRHNDNDGLGDFIGGVVIGSMLDNNNSSGGWGGSGSWGGGGSSGGWGGGGGGGGSFGGGGGGGSFGGDGGGGGW